MRFSPIIRKLKLRHRTKKFFKKKEMGKILEWNSLIIFSL